MYPVTIGGGVSCFYLFDITQYKTMEVSLAHSQKMQAIGQLAGGISHDFNNLLTAILGFCDLLLIKHPAGDPSFAEIMQIKQNSNRAANLVRQLLAISRKQVLKPKILDISEVLAELANLVRRLIGENIDLDIIHGTNLKPIKVDQGQLEQVIINLVVNARDAIFKHNKVKGKISITTSNVNIDKSNQIDKSFFCPEKENITPGEYVLISVQDNGIGIAKNVINKIFEPFFSTKAIGAGTGLGLSTVYSIIKQTGGNLYCSSQENQGSIFNVYLKAENHVISSHDTNTEVQLVTKDLTGNATILLVEDEIPVRMFCTHALKNKGYNVIEAENGEKALEIFKQNNNKIDLIISDVIMPGINGPTLINEIKKTAPNIKVIFISGYAEEAFSDQTLLNKDFYFLSKPFTLTQLATQVKDVLSIKETVEPTS
jgi:two-component system, cell cycle sensor histidine kinase and response regulator CckA